MKKLLAMLLALVMVLSFAACGTTPEEPEVPEEPETPTEPETPAEPTSKSINWKQLYDSGRMRSQWWDDTSDQQNNYTSLFMLMGTNWVPFSRYIFNTVFISFCGTFGNVIFASYAAYALAKIKFPGRQFLFSIVVYSLMFNNEYELYKMAYSRMRTQNYISPIRAWLSGVISVSYLVRDFHYHLPEAWGRIYRRLFYLLYYKLRQRKIEGLVWR